jgi:hypothetical protein
MPSEVLVTVLYDGKPLVEVFDDGTYKTKMAGIEASRIGGHLIDVENVIGQRLELSKQLVMCATINPYKAAMLSTWKTVMDEIPREDRNGLSLKDIGAVMNAVTRIAKRSEQ